MKIATIARNATHSPHMVEQDTAILECIEQELRAQGHSVTRLDEKDDFCGYDVICHMSRSRDTLQKIRMAEERGCRAINSCASIANCSRTEMMAILQRENIYQPQYMAVTDEILPQANDLPGWIKKGEGWSLRKEDVAYVTNVEEAKKAVKEIAGSVIYCRHIVGDVVKFYGVKDKYFAHCYPNPEKTKFGWERINGPAKHHPFSSEELRATAFAAAQAIGLDVFGGDCIITPDGDIYIIDINDFPSFSAVRKDAAQAIARTIIESR